MKLLSIDSHIGLGNAAKGMSGRLVRAYCETTDRHLRAAIERLAGAVEIFKRVMANDVIKRIPGPEDPKNVAARVYHGEKFTSDEDAAELCHMEMEATTAGYGTIVFEPDGEEK